ncbi:hypothetical protein MYSTI_02084 [Myxococcus stipitatus DSM 14675]|uniref:Lipoprotein n=1 Tax=Myxococcus stipitatus (strain DSM 14675 / JCM 12634 / Mx s8) TaxID=1278073 RepID=L7U5P6_MYXSD|nr:hypothetical protein [Myxococcus stipitatus]AGC43413.1 hypothetical protein MYSTI_02084 [Myxococcus stipitatus DSM 14675]
MNPAPRKHPPRTSSRHSWTARLALLVASGSVLATSEITPSTGYIPSKELPGAPLRVTSAEPVVIRTLLVRARAGQPEELQAEGQIIVKATVRWRSTDAHAPHQPWFQVQFEDRWGRRTGDSTILDGPEVTQEMEAGIGLREGCRLTEACEWPVTVLFALQDNIGAEGTVDVEWSATGRVSVEGTSDRPKGFTVEVLEP